jgi:hypothetical protein
MTILLKKYKIEEYRPIFMICDSCGKLSYRVDISKTDGGGQPYIRHFTFGHEESLAFSDDMSYELDLCVECIRDLFGPLLKKRRRKDLENAKKIKRCECENPSYLGNEDVPSIPEGFARCQRCRRLVCLD